MRRAVWLSLVGLIISTLTVVAAPASADTGAGTLAFRSFRNANSGMCLDIFDASQAPGANAIQWPCNGEGNQVFEVIAAKNGGVHLKAVHSGQCLDVFNADRNLGTRLIQWPCNFDDNQRFARTFYSDGSWRLHAVHSGLCVDILWGSTNPGTWAIQWNCHNGATQRWF